MTPRQPPKAAFTSRELLVGGYVATALWFFSVALLVTLAVWSVEPHWVA